jgi:hypothetical protein
MAKNLFFSSNALYLPDGNPVLLGQILFGSLFRSVFLQQPFRAVYRPLVQRLALAAATYALLPRL